MRQYEVTFIVDPVLSSDEAKSTVQTYINLLKDEGCTIVHIDEMGLRQLAYPINRRNTGVYYCVEFQPKDGTVIDRMELSFRRDERIMRFLVAKLDKYGIKYNEDKRAGKIGKVKKKEEKKEEKSGRSRPRTDRKPAHQPKEEKAAAPPVEEKVAEPVADANPTTKAEEKNDGGEA